MYEMVFWPALPIGCNHTTHYGIITRRVAKTKSTKPVKKRASKGFNYRDKKLVTLVILVLAIALVAVFTIHARNNDNAQLTTSSDTSHAEPEHNAGKPDAKQTPSPGSSAASSSPSTSTTSSANYCSQVNSDANQAYEAAKQAAQRQNDARVSELSDQMANGTIDLYGYKQQISLLHNGLNQNIDAAYSAYAQTVKDKGCEPTSSPPVHF
jgi:hypothetical protein